MRGLMSSQPKCERYWHAVPVAVTAREACCWAGGCGGYGDMRVKPNPSLVNHDITVVTPPHPPHAGRGYEFNIRPGVGGELKAVHREHILHNMDVDPVDPVSGLGSVVN
ncbi:hypothetical protein RRG08_004891 [Elysia crispata]|uniref:Uncharacterized protein n=1 Tax=Elysia crispata TaxID=231223 RepID=A0AAE0ZHS0_9GAST|nr:hypothetical protein RRG08_004891 [Elysia crispata]